MNLNRGNISFRRPSSHYTNIESKSNSPWNRRLDTFKLIQQSQSPLGPQEEEIEKIYAQIHYLVEVLNDRFGSSMKKKEENCMIAFKKVMLSIEKDLKEIKQQVDDSQKITRDTSEDDTVGNIQKQLAFFRDESIALSKKLKIAEDKIKELKKRNKELEDDALQDHQMLLQSQKERKALKTLLLTAKTLNSVGKNQENSAPSSAFSSRQLSRQGNEWSENKHNSDFGFESRRSSAIMTGSILDKRSRISRSNSSKSVESKYKKENLHFNSLKEQLEQALKQKASFLNNEKSNELVQIVTSVVMKNIQAQDQQLTTLNSKIARIKKFYQSLLKTQLGVDVSSNLIEILHIFSDTLQSYKGREGLDNISRLSARMTENESTTFYKTELMNYRNSFESEGLNRSSVLGSIRNINEKYGQFGTEDKIQIIQKLLNDSSLNTLLNAYVESQKAKSKGETSPTRKLISTRETGSHPQSPLEKKHFESENEEKNGQSYGFKNKYFLSQTQLQNLSEKPPLINPMLHKQQSISSLPSQIQSYDPNEERNLHLRHCRALESQKEQRGTSIGWISSEARENRSINAKDSQSFGQLEGSGGMDISFSTPVDIVRQRTFGDQEFQIPPGEEKPGRDFRKKFLVKTGKTLGS